MRCNEEECVAFIQDVVANCSGTYNRVSYVLARLLEKMGYKELTTHYYFIGNPYEEPVMYKYRNGDSNIRVAAPLLYDVCRFIYRKTHLVFNVDKRTFQYCIGSLHKENEVQPRSKFTILSVNIDEYPSTSYRAEIEKALYKICTIYLRCKKIEWG